MIHPTRILLTAALLAAVSSVPAIADSVTFQYTVDTTSQSGSYGYVDFQLNVGSSATAAQPVFANVFDFSGAVPNPSDGNNDETGTATGSLPDSLSFAAAPGFNDYFEGITFGTEVSFYVTLDGSGVSLTGNGADATDATFGVFFYDSTINTLFTVDPDTGAAGEVDIQANGVPVTTGDLTPVPEPASLNYLLCAIVAGLFMALRRERPAAI